MSLLLPVAAMLALWAWATGRLRRVRWADALAGAAALLGVRLLTHGEWLPGIVGLGWAAGWLWHRRRATALPHSASPSAATMSAAEARGLLDLPPAADAAMIRDAHRRLIVRVHPDAGGSAELARRVNLARDALLADLNRSRPRAS